MDRKTEKKKTINLTINLTIILTSILTTTRATRTTTTTNSNDRIESHPRFIKPVQLSFTQGFIFGQLTFLILLLCFLRYVVFEDANSTSSKTSEPPSKQPLNPIRRSHKRARRLSILDKSHPTLESELLSKLSYDLSTHPPETTDWLNVLLAQAIIAYRSLLHGLDDDDPTAPKAIRAKRMVEEALNFARGESPGFVSLDYITVTEVDFGKEFPVCTNARIRPADETGRMRIEVDIDYSDHITLAIETRVVVNFPTARFAVLPISLGLTLKQLSATIMTEIPPIAIPLPTNSDPIAPSPAILMSLDPDFTLSMSTTSLLGSRAKLQDIPKIEQLILGRLRAWIVDNLVWPKVRVLKLPGLGNKGSVEDSADGEGEYVWVEGTTPEKPSTPGSSFKEPKPPKSTIREADEDEGPIPSSASYEPTPEIFRPTLIPLQNKTLQAKYHHLQLVGSTRSPHTARRSSPSEINGIMLPNRQRRPSSRLECHPQHPPDSDGYSNHPKPPGAIPSSDRSITSPRDHHPHRHHHHDLGVSFPVTPPLAPDSYFPTSNDHHRSTRQNRQRSHDGGAPSPTAYNLRSTSTGDQIGWARAGGMTGVPIGLGSPVPNLGFGIRERIRDAERTKSLRAAVSGDPTDSQR